MSERDGHRDQNDQKREYSVDEILAEYGSGGSDRSKVVDFPEAEERAVLQQTGRLPGVPKQQAGHAPAAVRQQTIRFPAVSERQQAAPPEQPPTRPGADVDEPTITWRKQGGGQETPRGEGSAAAPPDDGRDGIVEIEPATPLHGLAARLSTIRRRADHYADHMYDQAQPDEEAQKAEKYLPGVDREESAKPPRRPAQRRRPARPAPPDTSPADLSARYAHGLKSKKVRAFFAVLCAALCAAASVVEPAMLSLPEVTASGVPIAVVRQSVLLGLLALTGALCAEVIGKGLWRFAKLRLGPDTLLALAFFATAGDSVHRLLARELDGLPCCAVTAFALALGLWGESARRQGDRLSARAAAQVREPFVVTLDEGKWSGRPVYSKWSGTQAGFGSQLQSEDGVQRAYVVAAPLLLLACLVCAGMTAAARDGWGSFLRCLSATLTAACAWSAPLVYAFPYRKLARRLFGSGAALAGWPGVERCREAGILMGDQDLFPTGSVQVSGVRIFGDFSNEKVVAYTATMLRLLDCGLTRPFHDLLRSQGAFYREASQVRCHEGGVTGAIRNQEVFVGTASFMYLMDVDMPQGLNVKHAIFCAIDGQLAGIFALRYTMGQSVRPCLSTLMRSGASPILATRDPNLIPALLGEKFKLPVDKMEFPPVERRLELSSPDQEHDGVPVALLSREGLGAYCDAVVGARRLRAATRGGIFFALAGGVLGMALTFYLVYLDAASMTPLNFLVYMALWLVPTVLLGRWVEQF